MINRKILIMCFLAFCSCILFPEGGQEDNQGAVSPRILKQWNVKLVDINSSTTGVADVNSPEYVAKYFKNMGKHKVSMVFNDNDKPAYALVHIDGKFFNGFTGEEITIDGLSDYLVASDTEIEVEQSNSDLMDITLVKYNNSKWPNELQQFVLGPDKVDNVVNLIWYNQSENESIDIVLFTNVASKSSFVINASLKTEFFPGERELFSSYGSGTYKQKVLALMGNMLPDDFKVDTGNKLGNNTTWTMFDAAFSDSEYKDQMLNQLKISIGQQFAFRYYNNLEKNIPFLSFGREEFESIYGDKFNIYVKAYLDYCYRVNKPPLSYLIDTSLEDTGRFDYRQYEKISKYTGYELATAALRYLTWGVEYTSNSLNTVPVSKSGSNIFEHNRDIIDEWVTEINNGTRRAGYFPNYGTDAQHAISDIVSENNLIGKTHIIQVDSDHNESCYTLAGRKNENKELLLNRIELWTAENVLNHGISISDVFMDDRIALDIIKKNITDKDLNTQLGASRYFNFNLTEDINVKAVSFIGKAVGEINSITFAPDGTTNDDNSILIATNPTGREWVLNPTEFNTEKFVQYVYLCPITNTSNISLRFDGEGSFEISELSIFEDDPVQYLWVYPAIFDAISEHSIGFYDVFKTPEIYSPAETIYVGQNIDSNVINKLLFSTDDNNPEEIIGVGEVIANDNCTVKDWNRNINYALLFPHELIEIWGPEETTNSSRNIKAWIRRSDGLEGSNFVKYNNSIDIDVNQEIFLIHFPFKKSCQIKEVVLFEGGTGSSEITEQVKVFGGSNKLLEEIFVKSNFSSSISVLKVPVTTPFVNGDSQKTIGNPIPFCWNGVDNPRSFAYKMSEQIKARNWYEDRVTGDQYTDFDTSKAIDSANMEFFNSAYVTGDQMTSYRNGKPFLPGYRRDQDYTFEYLSDNYVNYIPDRVAGTDMSGLLAGAITMTSIFDRFFNLFNVKIGEEYNVYYRMEERADGLGSDGKPLYNANNDNTIINGDYSIRWKDIEKMTVLVPDVSEIQVGDLLVNYSVTGTDNDNIYDGNVQMGMIVALDWNSSDISYGNGYIDAEEGNLLNKVYVLTTANTIEAVTLGTWGSGASMYGGLTTDPRDFQIRRLIAMKPGETDINTAVKDSWEVIDDDIESLFVNIHFFNEKRSNVKHDMSHWIPNTNEIHPIGNIEIGRNTFIGVQSLNESMRDIVLKSPADMYYDSQDDGNNGNVNNNKGTTFEFYAIDGENYNNAYLIASFEYDSSHIGREITYNVNYKDEYFENIGPDKGKGKGNNYLRVNAANMLEAKIGSDTYDLFGIKALNDIWPGDDILLRFGLLNDEEHVAEVQSEDFLAVYDKKLLWRANLYIEEDFEDWNNMNPWLNNQWNVVNGINGASIDGGQIEIKDYHNWPNDGNLFVRNGVAYGWGCEDTPFEFNEELESQATAVTNLRNTNADYAALAWTNGSTRAPANDWDNYIFPTRTVGSCEWKEENDDGTETTKVDKYYAYPSSTPINNPAASQHTYHIDGSNASIPGLSTFNSFDKTERNAILDGDDDVDFRNWDHSRSDGRQDALTSGIDCSGLASIAPYYTGTLYLMSQDASLVHRHSSSFYSDEITWQIAPPLPTPPAENATQAQIEAYQQDKATKEELILDMSSRIIPGDLVAVNGHVMIVQSIEYPDGPRLVTSRDQIKLIHSTGKSSKFRVSLDEDWGDMENDSLQYQLRRYKR